jgi:hypothetical protein
MNVVLCSLVKNLREGSSRANLGGVRVCIGHSDLVEPTWRANSRTDRAGNARQARIILLLAEGHTWDDVSERIDCSRGFVASWSRRFNEQRIAGLFNRHLEQVAIVLTPELEARNIRPTYSSFVQKTIRYI